jgi:hypothetical protein
MHPVTFATHTHLELPGMNAIVALDKRVPEVVNRVPLQPRKGAVVEVQVVRVAEMVAGAVLQILRELGNDLRRLLFPLLSRLFVVSLVESRGPGSGWDCETRNTAFLSSSACSCGRTTRQSYYIG